MRITTLRGLLMAGLGLLPFITHAISRVGTGRIGSEELGFEANLPQAFQLIRQLIQGLELEGVARNSNSSLSFGGFQKVKLHVYRFAENYPEWKASQRSDLRDLLDERRWVREAIPNPCVDQYSISNARLTTRIVLWGVGRGIVLVSENGDSRTNSAAKELGRNVELKEDSCKW